MITRRTNSSNFAMESPQTQRAFMSGELGLVKSPGD